VLHEIKAVAVELEAALEAGDLRGRRPASGRSSV
jgi:hypothetical protein